MRFRRKRENTSLYSYLNFVFGFAKYLLIVILILSAAASKKVEVDGTKPNAEYTVETRWPDATGHDIDGFMKLPNGNIVWYNHRQAGIANLERDDTGSSNDVLEVNGIKYQNLMNMELIAIRAAMPGEYIFAVFNYRTDYSVINKSGVLTSMNLSVPNNAGDDLPEAIPVSIEFKKLNPTVSILFNKKLEFTKVRQELFVTRFVIAADGSVSFYDDIPTSIVSEVIDAMNQTSLYPAGGIR